MDARRAEDLYKKADAGRWKVPAEVLSDALARSADKAFAGRSPSGAELDRYLNALHLPPPIEQELWNSLTTTAAAMINTPEDPA